METVKCDNCGEKLKKYPSEVSQHNFCNLECCNEWQSEERDYSFQENSVELECEKCGDDYKVPKHKEESSRFCSRQCSLRKRPALRQIPRKPLQRKTVLRNDRMTQQNEHGT